MKGIEKIVIFTFLIIFFVSSVNAIPLAEVKLSELGQTNFVLDKPDYHECLELQFEPTVDLNSEVYGILSVKAEFSPANSKKSFIEVFLNGEKVNEIKSNEFINGMGRFNVVQGKILEENHLRICAKTSFETSKIQIFNDSTIGYYLKPNFEKPGSFQLIITPKEPMFLEEFEVKAVLKNYGSESADVFFKYRRDVLEKETPETELVKGQISENKTVPECQKRDTDTSCVEPGVVEFSYFLRPKMISPITLLPSIVEYKNTFGETIILESNRPTIRIIEPVIKIKPFLTIEKEQFLVGEKANINLVISNEGQNPIYNLSLKLKTNGLSFLQGTEKETIDFIDKKQTISREYTLSSIEQGQFNVSCSIDYLDYNAMQSNCNELTVEYKNPGADITMIGSVVLVALSIAVFVFLHLKK